MPSTLADIARAEQVEDEPETPEVPLAPDEAEQAEEEEREEQEHEQPAEEREPAPTPEQIEALNASWERERNRHMRELEKRDPARYAGSEVCVLCEGHGLFWPVIPEPHHTMRLQAVTQVLGAEPPVEYLEDEATEACQRCGALGMLKTGSRVQNQREHTCPECNGQGWKTKLALAAPQPLFAQSSQPNGAANVTPTQQGAPDAWGRPVGHPHYGFLPSQVGV